MQKILRAAPAYEASPEIVDHVQRDTGIEMDTRPETISPDNWPTPLDPRRAAPTRTTLRQVLQALLTFVGEAP